MKKLPVILIAIVIAAVVAVGGTLGYKMVKQSDDKNFTTDYSKTEIQPDYTEEQIEIPGEAVTSEFVEEESTTETSVLPSETATQGATSSDDNQSATETRAKSETSTVVEKLTTVATTVAAKVNTEFNKIFTMPKAPKYVRPDVDIDFDSTSLLAYKYDPDGNYYYTDDKNAWQRGFGYNQIYDKLAVVSAMYYDTVRNAFTYDGKDYLVQLWKGQYGYYFVGGEIGIYTKTKSGSTYACADKEDWVKMEMTFFWDESKNGTYNAIFSRPYDDYWWCTGFVPGLETLTSMKSREQFRLVGHITFKSTEMAELFAAAMEKNGFTRVSAFNKDVKDTFVQAGPDVGFCWQSINQHVI